MTKEKAKQENQRDPGGGMLDKSISRGVREGGGYRFTPEGSGIWGVYRLNRDGSYGRAGTIGAPTGARLLDLIHRFEDRVSS
jgi:hypothetical protein